MRLVHSFSSAHCSDESLFMHLSYFVLSCIYAKRSGFDIVVHCDNRAKRILQLAPYDEIITDLEGVDPPSNSTIYAWSKFYAMKDEDLGNIHIDGDVFLKSPILKKRLNFDNYDCIVQCLEDKNIYGGDQHPYWQRAAIVFARCEYPSWAKRECTHMFNCGVVGFNNQRLKEEYFSTYNDMLRQHKKVGLPISNTTPDVIIEQQFLKDLADAKGYKVKCLLPVESNVQLYSYATSIGYQHVIGISKGQNLNKILGIIKEYDDNIYCELMNIRNELGLKK